MARHAVGSKRPAADSKRTAAASTSASSGSGTSLSRVAAPDPYGSYARFYDATQGPRVIAHYLHLVREHHPHARTLLELACGTGELLTRFAAHYEVAGLDISDAMLERARAKLPDTPLHRQSMAGFRLADRFDAIVCPYDSINHLVSFADWTRTFRAAKRHLAPGGVFVFDVHTEANLARLAAAPPHVLAFGDDYLIMKVDRERGGIHAWQVEVFEHLRDRYYLLHRQTIRERAFATDKVLEALGRIFPFVRAYDAQGWSRPKRSSRRLFYVCGRGR